MSGRQFQLAEWMGGFVDGEGNIQTKVQKSGRHSPDGYKMAPVAEVSQAYVAGLMDAEGCVSQIVGKNDLGRFDYGQNPQVQIQQGRNEALEERVAKYAEHYGVDYNLHTYDPPEEGYQPQVRFIVGSQESVRRFLEPIRDICAIKGRQIAIMLDEILPRMSANRHTTKRGFLEIMAYRDLMNAYKGGIRGKYNLEYFEELWDMKLDTSRLALEEYVLEEGE